LKNSESFPGELLLCVKGSGKTPALAGEEKSIYARPAVSGSLDKNESKYCPGVDSTIGFTSLVSGWKRGIN